MKVLLFSTILLSGLVAGLMYAYSCSVNPGLKNLADAEYVKAMQSINIAIQNAVFFVSFMGLLLVFPITVYRYYRAGVNADFYIILIAGITYFGGVFGVTAGGNIPLNNMLANFNISTADNTAIAAMRKAFEQPWNTWHNIRTIAAIASFACTILLAVKQKV